MQASARHFSVQLQSPIFSLPRELWEMVYDYYFALRMVITMTISQGNWLRQVISPWTSHLQTCRLAVAELNKRRLLARTIYFTTVYEETLQSLLESCGKVFDYVRDKQCSILADVYRFLDAPAKSGLEKCFPHLSHLIHSFPAKQKDFGLRIHSYGEAPSISEMFANAALRIFCENSRLVRNSSENSKNPRTRCLCDDAPGLSTLNLIPCTCPTEENSVSILDVCGLYRLGNDFVECKKSRMSAASMAVKFLSNLSHDRRVPIRRIVLREDFLAATKPECHAQGLIPYCKENPGLYIERRVNLWRAVFPDASGPLVLDSTGLGGHVHGLEAHYITKGGIGLWIAEARALFHLSLGWWSNSDEDNWDIPKCGPKRCSMTICLCEALL